MHWGTYGWSMGFGWTGMLLFWGLVMVGIYFAARFAMRGNDGNCQKDTPINIINNRYAHGQITREEYERMKEDVRKLNRAVDHYRRH